MELVLEEVADALDGVGSSGSTESRKLDVLAADFENRPGDGPNFGVFFKESKSPGFVVPSED